MVRMHALRCNCFRKQCSTRAVLSICRYSFNETSGKWYNPMPFNQSTPPGNRRLDGRELVILSTIQLNQTAIAQADGYWNIGA